MHNTKDVEISPPNVQVENGEHSAEETIRQKIIHILKIYPIISHSMLQIGLGSSLPPSIWRPVLSAMIEDDEIVEDHLFLTTPTGRQQTYTQLKLAKQ